MSSSLDHKCQRCGSQFHGQICPFCTITGLDVNALLASEGLTVTPAPSSEPSQEAEEGQVVLVDVVSNRVYPFNPPVCRFGRDISNDIVLTGDKSLSRFHFQVSFKNDEYFVEDAGSRNGTFLNGSPCTSPRKILNGDIISAGMSRYRLVVGGEDIEGLPANGASHETSAAASAPTIPPSAPNESKSAPAKEQPKTPPLESKPAAAAKGIPDLAAELARELSMPDIGSTKDKSETVKLSETSRSSESVKPAQAPAAKAESKPVEVKPAEKPADKPAAKASENKTTQPGPDPAKRLYEEGQALLNRGPGSDADEASVDKLLPGKEDELGDTASRFLKLANPLDALFQGSSQAPKGDNGQKEKAKPAPPETKWPAWCLEFSFPELDDMQAKAKNIEDQLKAKQEELDQINSELQEVQLYKNRLLATRDDAMVEACGAVFEKLGWKTARNGSTACELVLSADDKAVAIARIVCTETQPKPNELATLVSSLSNYWSDHGVEPKGILLVAFVLDGPPASRPELATENAEYAAKKNVCLMNSLQLLSIYREIALSHRDVESIKSDLLGASGQLSGFELPTTAKA